MIGILNLIILDGLLAILYGYIVGKQILSASTCNSKMQEIASAIQEGARAYLNRHYKTLMLIHCRKWHRLLVALQHQCSKH